MIDLNGFGLPPGIEAQVADKRLEILKGREDVIPKGRYCYTLVKHDPDNGKARTKVCPYWAIDTQTEHTENGYCALMKKGDWQETNHISLLWNQVKQCEINKNQ